MRIKFFVKIEENKGFFFVEAQWEQVLRSVEISYACVQDLNFVATSTPNCVIDQKNTESFPCVDDSLEF